MAEYGPKVRIDRRCSDCPACVSESYRCQSDSGSDVYCEHPSLGERKRIGDTTWSTPDWCPALSAQQPEAVAGGWVKVSLQLPERGQHIEGRSDFGQTWKEEFDPDEPLGYMREWRPITAVQPQVAVSDELVRRVLDGLPDCPPTENDVRIALTAALRPDATP